MKFLKTLLLILSFNSLYSQSLPDFNIVDLKGNVLTKEDLKGKNVYINIFESWCSSCIVEIPIINETQHNLNEILFIALTPAKRKKAKHFQEKYGFNLQVFPEADEICKQLKVSHYPAHFFIDKKGNLKEIKFNISVTWKNSDYKNGKPPKTIFDSLLFEQNRLKLENELRLSLKHE